MDSIQLILVYITLGVAILYLAKKFLIPKKFLSHKKQGQTGCGQDNCGCH